MKPFDMIKAVAEGLMDAVPGGTQTYKCQKCGRTVKLPRGDFAPYPLPPALLCTKCRVMMVKLIKVV